MREDIHYFPHICELIVGSAPPASLPALRAVSPVFAELVDRRLLHHVVYGVREARLSSALLPDAPLVRVRPELVRVLDLAMSLRYASPPSGADSGDDGDGGGGGGGGGAPCVAGLSAADECGSGNAKAPWVLADPPDAADAGGAGGAGGAGDGAVRLPAALPHLPGLRALRCLNYQPVVFPHAVRYTPVPVVVYPASRAISWSPSRQAGGRIVGGGVRIARAVIAFRRPPAGDFSLYFRANQHERLDIVLVPGAWGRWLGGTGGTGGTGAVGGDGFSVAEPPGAAPDVLPGYSPPGGSDNGAGTGAGVGPGPGGGASGVGGVAARVPGAEVGEIGPRNPMRGPPLVDRVTSGTFWVCLTDEVAHHVENGGACTVVGLEGWDAATRRAAPGWDGAWADILARDVALDELDGLGDGLGPGLGLGTVPDRQPGGAAGRLAFRSLAEWRAADENADVRELVT